MTKTKKGEAPVFGSFDDFLLDGGLGITPYGDWYDYAIGYVQAGAVLIEQVDEKNANLDRQTAVFPILFCYRHYLELMLKHFIVDANFVQGKESDCQKFNHDLPSLWKKAQSLLEGIPLHDSQKEYPRIKRIVGEFASQDPASASFRYPRDKRGNAVLKDIWEINLASLYERMHEAHESLGIVARELSAHVSFRRAELEGPPDDLCLTGDEECPSCD